MLNQSQPQYFSGDSQDSSKGYTSISVREPLRHIRPNTNSNPTGKVSSYIVILKIVVNIYNFVHCLQNP